MYACEMGTHHTVCEGASLVKTHHVDTSSDAQRLGVKQCHACPVQSCPCNVRQHEIDGGYRWWNGVSQSVQNTARPVPWGLGECGGSAPGKGPKVDKLQAGGKGIQREGVLHATETCRYMVNPVKIVSLVTVLGC